MIVNKHKGQVLLELLIVAPSLALVLTFLCAVIYLNFSHLFLDHYLYEALICVAQKTPVHQCKAKSFRPVQKILFYGRVQQFKIVFSHRSAGVLTAIKGKLCYRIKNWKFCILRQIHPNQFIRPAKKTLPVFI